MLSPAKTPTGTTAASTTSPGTSPDVLTETSMFRSVGSLVESAFAKIGFISQARIAQITERRSAVEGYCRAHAEAIADLANAFERPVAKDINAGAVDRMKGVAEGIIRNLSQVTGVPYEETSTTYSVGAVQKFIQKVAGELGYKHGSDAYNSSTLAVLEKSLRLARSEISRYNEQHSVKLAGTQMKFLDTFSN